MLPLTGDGSGRLYFEDLLVAADFKAESGADYSLVIRPERLFEVKSEAVDPEQTIVFNGTVREFVFQGETAFALTSIGDQHDLSFRFGTDSSSTEHDMRPRDPISLGLHRRDAIIIPQTGEA